MFDYYKQTLKYSYPILSYFGTLEAKNGPFSPILEPFL